MSGRRSLRQSRSQGESGPAVEDPQDLTFVAREAVSRAPKLVCLAGISPRSPSLRCAGMRGLRVIRQSSTSGEGLCHVDAVDAVCQATSWRCRCSRARAKFSMFVCVGHPIQAGSAHFLVAPRPGLSPHR